MKYIFNDLTAQLLAQALLEPGEQLAGKVMAKYEPWYTRFFRFDFLMPYTLYVATDRRLLLLEHKRGFFSGGYELSSIESIPWNDVEELAAKGLFVKNKLRIKARTQRGPKRMTMRIPTFFWLAPMKRNGKELMAVVGAFQARRSLAPAPYGQPQALHPSSVPPAYGQLPQQGYSQAPVPQYPQGYPPGGGGYGQA